MLAAAAGGRTGDGTTLVVSSSDGRQVSFVDSSRGVVASVAVGAAPHGIALAPDGRAYVATTLGIAVVDTARRKRIALVSYRAPVGPPRFGEYRPGGMGIASSPDGRRIYAGVYLPGRPSRLEVLDTARLEIVASVPVWRTLRRAGLPRLTCAPREQARRYEWPCPGDLLHIDSKRFSRFTRPGHAVTGVRDRTGAEKPMRVRHEFVHSIVDDHSRLA